MCHNHQWCPPSHQPHHASPKVPMPPSLLRRHVWRRPFVAVVGRPRVAMVPGITESKGWMGITGQILTASTICMPEGSRYVLRKGILFWRWDWEHQSYGWKHPILTKQKNKLLMDFEATLQPFVLLIWHIKGVRTDHPKEPSILDLSLGTPKAVSFASIKSSSSNFSEWQTW